MSPLPGASASAAPPLPGTAEELLPLVYEELRRLAAHRMAGQMKKSTDVLDIPSINNMAAERVGYPTQKPLALLEVLLAHPQRVMSKAALQEKLYDWSGSEPESNALEVHISSIRRKLGRDIIETARGLGYRMAT